MKRWRGTVKNGQIVLQQQTRLPEGTQVEVRVRASRKKKAHEDLRKRKRIVDHILGHQIKGPIGMDEIIQEDKREREERWDYLFGEGHDADAQKPPADR